MVSAGVERLFGGLVGVLGGAGALYLAESIPQADWLYPDRTLMFWAAIVAILAALGFMVWGAVTVIISLVASKRKRKVRNVPLTSFPAPSPPTTTPQIPLPMRRSGVGGAAVVLKTGRGARMSDVNIEGVHAVNADALHIENEGDTWDVSAQEIHTNYTEPPDDSDEPQEEPAL